MTPPTPVCICPQFFCPVHTYQAPAPTPDGLRAALIRVNTQAERMKRMIRGAYTGDVDTEARTVGRSVSMNPNPFIVIEDFERALTELEHALASPSVAGTPVKTGDQHGKESSDHIRQMHEVRQEDTGSGPVLAETVPRVLKETLEGAEQETRRQRLATAVAGETATASMEPAGTLEGNRAYWTRALELLADQDVKDWVEKRDKIQATIRYAAHIWNLEPRAEPPGETPPPPTSWQRAPFHGKDVKPSGPYILLSDLMPLPPAPESEA